jgi:hypothetical protein
MPLSADQRAMLGLLLERGQTYADISGLLGVTEDEVRARARAALAEVGGTDPDRHVGLTDYLLGQADPIGRADAVRHLRDDPDDRALAERVLSALAEVAPGADLPRLPGEARTAPHLRAPRRRRSAAGAPGDEGGAAGRALSGRQARLFVALGSGAVILAVAIAAVAGAFSGGGSPSPTVASTPTTTTQSTAGSGAGGSAGGNGAATTGNQNLTAVPLRSVGGIPGKGVATFGVATQNTPFLDVQTAGLTPAPKNQVYSVWLAINPRTRQGYPVAPLLQSHNQFNIPQVVLPILPKMKTVDIVVSPTKALRNEISAVVKAKKPKLILPEPGSLALRGAIPRKAHG